MSAVDTVRGPDHMATRTSVEPASRDLPEDRSAAQSPDDSEFTELSRGNRSVLVRLLRRLEDKAPGRVEKVPSAYTSQRCSACGHVAAESRESQALFRCVACKFVCNADVNAARNIAAGHAVTARGGDGDSRPVSREPQLALLAS
jgi:hypothetical protein